MPSKDVPSALYALVYRFLLDRGCTGAAKAFKKEAKEVCTKMEKIVMNVRKKLLPTQVFLY